ncbi:YhcN/YlaJ family sporulation lipoprotein [Bacillus sp. JJ722]|uniref:YhcN/YlaJ family sporulation lipoprotein n=1 Tax=Bacillus sp. JJ722 TaxID=3122973 RepID=UPI0030001A24
MIKLRLMFLTMLLIAGGCQMNDANTDKNDAQVNEQQVQNVKNEINSKDNQEIANRLEKATLEVPHVKAANAIVLGDYVFVAVDVDENIDRSQVGSIKYSVSERLKNDPYGKKAVIVADPDIVARLKEVGEDIKAGEPISGIMNELSDIAARVIPEIPEENMPPADTNDKTNQMPAKDQKELQKEQQDQSNQQMTK